MDSELELVDSVSLTRPPEAFLEFSLTRPLTLDDLPGILAGPSAGVPRVKPLKALRNSHHALARQLALGVPDAHAALLTGYSPGYIASIRSDPAFAELVSFYTNQAGEVFVDIVGRMKTQGLSVLDELQRRLEEEPDSWTKRELMDYGEMLLGKVHKAETRAAGIAGTPGGVSISVNFVKPGDSALPGAGIVITQDKGA